MCKSYSTFGLFNMYFFFSSSFFSIIDLCSFSTVFLHYTAIVPFCLPSFEQLLQCHFGLFKWHCSYNAFFSFFFFHLYFFFLLNIYKNPHIYCYTDTTNFTIFSQLLRFQFFISQNKIIKYETVANHN